MSKKKKKSKFKRLTKKNIIGFIQVWGFLALMLGLAAVFMFGSGLVLNALVIFTFGKGQIADAASGIGFGLAATALMAGMAVFSED
jgi:hypothetical protein